MIACFPLPFQISIDVVGLVDEWAARFFEELDYINEGENGQLFSEMMRKDLPQVSMVFFWTHYFLMSAEVAPDFGETSLIM